MAKSTAFVLFILLQFGLGVLCLYKPRALIYGLVFTAILVLLPINIAAVSLSLWLYYIICAEHVIASNFSERLVIGQVIIYFLAKLLYST